MRIPTITGLILAGSVAVVTASPDPRETTERLRYNGGADEAKHADGDWVEIATPTPTSHGREYIDVGAGAGTFRRIRISATTGRPIVRMVKVSYKDGTQRKVRVDAVIDKQRPAYVDLKGAHEIERIVIEADTDSHGTYSLEGEVDTRDE
jgi:hypothetical protein